MTYRVLGLMLAFVAGASALVPQRSVAEEPATDKHCESFLSLKQTADQERGVRVDPMTVFLGVDVHCDRKVVEYGQSVLAQDSKLRKGWQKRLEKNWSAAYCKPGSASADAISHGWTIASNVRTLDGKEFRVTAICHEAMASL